MFAKKVGIDLGTFSILIYVKGRGIVLEEPSVVAISQRDDRIARIGRAPQSIEQPSQLMIGEGARGLVGADRLAPRTGPTPLSAVTGSGATSAETD